MAAAFGELVDLRLVQGLLQQFHELTGLPASLTDPAGDILRTDDGTLVGIDRQEICRRFHCAHPATAVACRRGDLELCRAALEQGGASHHCPNGLVEAAVPVMIDGAHVANLVAGQFLLAPPDEAAWAERAERYGFDRTTCRQALRAVPVFSRDLVARGMAFLDRLAGMLGEIGSKEKRLRGLVDTVARTRAEMESARRAAGQASESKGRFIASVSHELRSPLQSLELYAWLLRNALAHHEVDAALGHLEKLVKSCDRMAQLVGMMVRHSEMEQDGVKLAPVSVAVEALVTDILATAEERAIAKGLSLAGSFAPGLRPLRTDPDLLRTALANLVDNAIKFSDQGQVTVTVEPEGDGIRCTVSDSGCGIAPQHQRAVFEPFNQLEATGHKHSPGVGLGLAIARSAVELLGGSIDVASTPGVGSAFSILVRGLPEEAPCRPS